MCDVDEKSLRQTQDSLPGIMTAVADVSDEQSVERLFAQVDAQLGGLDVMVNNAGIAGPTGRVENFDFGELESYACRERHRTVFVCPLAVPRLRRGKNASMINLSSAAGHLGFPGDRLMLRRNGLSWVSPNRSRLNWRLMAFGSTQSCPVRSWPANSRSHRGQGRIPLQAP